MVFEKNFSFLSIIRLWELWSLGRSQFGHKGFDYHDLCRGQLDIAAY